MHGSSVVDWLLTGLMGMTGLYCLVRLLRPGTARGERQLDASEALKGLGMAAMALPYGLSRGVPVAVWAVLFGGAAAWSLAEGLRPASRDGAARAPEGAGSTGHAGHRGHHLYHAVGHLAMVYMAVVAASTVPGMAGMAGGAGSAGAPLLTGGLLLFFGGYALVSGVQLIGAPAAGAAAGVAGGPVGGARGSVARRLLGAPELPQACRMVLGMGMFAMLLTM
ncbi:DUF5134 domain-containing protein [Streptacidiphilus sp. PB12-B1b]|uniref:DUF5134 domain-containing protein n=1 Tax=Streptacidiphilus sp. PB12-B1b TaxID=2705012 RepID=UPI0015F81F9F|nr:DUF5134 domain-containing protein [Streptacidiphilus sp. PB12-B1b]QMU76066.1 DUF5134 domain-containing protein [Streptacidiphilus sp. PB12-B1b]